MKIYTKFGDKGMTSLFGGKTIPKDALRIEAYGTIDELNSFIGLLIASSNNNQHTILSKIQNKLFNIGSELACDPETPMIDSSVLPNDIIELEEQIDAMNEVLPPLKNFILPGGSQAIGYAHVCRTVCRRAERRLVGLKSISNVDQNILIYLNRLSDYFFVLARYIGFSTNVEEVIWKN